MVGATGLELAATCTQTMLSLGAMRDPIPPSAQVGAYLGLSSTSSTCRPNSDCQRPTRASNETPQPCSGDGEVMRGAHRVLLRRIVNLQPPITGSQSLRWTHLSRGPTAPMADAGTPPTPGRIDTPSDGAASPPEAATWGLGPRQRVTTQAKDQHAAAVDEAELLVNAMTHPTATGWVRASGLRTSATSGRNPQATRRYSSHHRAPNHQAGQAGPEDQAANLSP